MRARTVGLFFLLPAMLFLYIDLQELYLHIFHDLIVKGEVILIDEAGSENQHDTYRINYIVNGNVYQTYNVGSLDTSYRVKDMVVLYVISSRPDKAVIKGSFTSLIFSILLLSAFVIGYLYLYFKIP